MADFAEIVRRHRRIVAAEAAHVHAERCARHPSLLRPQTLALVEEGRAVPRETWEADLGGRLALREEPSRRASRPAPTSGSPPPPPAPRRSAWRAPAIR